jgi:LacI family transcriptional regulator
MRRRVTIIDVARAAGVHASTVSRALDPARRGRLSAAVARRIAATAKRLGYRPNALAAGLRTRRSRTVGILLPDIANPIFPPIVRAIEAALEDAGYIAIMANTDDDAARERLVVERMASRHVDGLVLATARRHDAIVAVCRRHAIPVVLINRVIAGAAVSAVSNDDEAGMALAVEHLAGLGHARIAHVAGPQSVSTGVARRKGFIAAMRRCGLAVDRRLIVNAGAFSEEEGRAAMQRLTGQRLAFTAVVAANDMLALGCYAACRERALRCPRDVSITGFNDMPFVDRLTPPLTTVRIQHGEMGRAAAQLVLDEIRAPDQPKQDIRLRPALVVRGSTAKPHM